MNEIRQMLSADIKNVTAVHLKSFPNFFLTFLGAAFLHEFYNAVLKDDSQIAFVSFQYNQITGFVIGTTRPNGIFRRIALRANYRLVLATIIPILKHPITILRLFNRFFSSTTTGYASGDALLMSIAVLPEFKGYGIGRHLLNEFVEVARKHRVKNIYLTTDKDNNDRVNKFYRTAGFEQIGSIVTPEYREMNKYCLSIQ